MSGNLSYVGLLALALCATTASAQTPVQQPFVPSQSACAEVCAAAKLASLNDVGKIRLQLCGAGGHCSQGGLLPLAV